MGGYAMTEDWNNTGTGGAQAGDNPQGTGRKRHMRSRLGRSRLAWLGLIDWLANLRDLGGLRGLRHLI